MEPRTVGALPSNWFDEEFGEALGKASAPDALAKIAKSSRLISAVQKAIDKFDKDRKELPPMCGPSRVQVIREAIAEELAVMP